MCGRVACSYQSVERAKELLIKGGVFGRGATQVQRQKGKGENFDDINKNDIDNGGQGQGQGHSRGQNTKLATETSTKTAAFVSSCIDGDTRTDKGIIEIKNSETMSKKECDNSNLSPGMKSAIFHLSLKKNKKDKTMELTSEATSKAIGNNAETSICIECTEKVWGLVPKSGTAQQPLPKGPSKHFSNLMFNARSDTLYDKRTFRDLALHKKQSCIWVIDGFYEWKTPDGDVIGNDGKKKQPYYVSRKDGEPLFLPGLWASVYTGRTNVTRLKNDDLDDGNSDNSGNSSNNSTCSSNNQTEIEERRKERETLESFTVLTTDAASPLRWLHHRQPVFIDDVQLAIEWLKNPTKQLVDQMSMLSSSRGSLKGSVSGSNDVDGSNNISDDILSWYPVTKRMSNVKYRNEDCNCPIKIEKVPSIKTFFGGGIGTKNNIQKKYQVPGSTKQHSLPILNKKRKAIKDFFVDDTSIIHSSLPKSSLQKRAKKEEIEVIDLTMTSSPNKEIEKESYDIKGTKKKGGSTNSRRVITNFFIPKSTK
jgi:putative SOS response-associated peptidase YedK